MISRSTTTPLNSNQRDKTGIHELATVSLVDNQLAYPTITIIDRNYSILFQQQSYLKAKDLISILEK
jgi:hypothetical protein